MFAAIERRREAVREWHAAMREDEAACFSGDLLNEVTKAAHQQDA
jgi:hypothetical protein